MAKYPVGAVLAGKFRVERVLGEGGMGIVLAARHLSLDDRVAIKLLRGDLANNDEIVSRFIREARAARRITSEHATKVSDVGQLEDGSPYMVMEYLEGNDLAQELAERGALPLAEVACFVLQACEALAEAHSAGIVHRDLKPANLFLTKRADGTPSIKVLDFGIAKIGNETAVTKTSARMGSALYMSPEQVRSTKHVDARSDLWALGVILFELLSGRSPFLAEDLAQVVFKITLDAIPRLREVAPGLPPEIDAVIDACLQRDVALRLPSVAPLARVLGAYAGVEGAISVARISRIINSASTDSLPGREATALDVMTHGSVVASVAPVLPTEHFVSPTQTDGAWGATSPHQVPNVSAGRSKAVFAALAFASLAAGATVYLLTRNNPANSSKSGSADSTKPPPAAEAVDAPPGAKPSSSTEPALTVPTVPEKTKSAPSASTQAKPVAKPIGSAVKTMPKDPCNPAYYYVGGVKTYYPGCE